MQSSIRTRLLLALLAVAVLSAGALSAYFLNELEAYGVRKLGERLGREAQLVAAVAANLGMSRTTSLQKIVTAPTPLPNSRVAIVDTEGTILADTLGSTTVGTPFANAEELAGALAGESSAVARSSASGKTALYVAYPIVRGDRVVGAAYVSAETFSIISLLRDYRWRLLGVVGLFIAATLLLAEVIARWLAAPLARLEAATTQFAGGDHSIRVPPSGPRETRALAGAFNGMADDVERVVSSLKAEERLKSQFVSDVSHELRTPLTAIRGAAETLLDGDVPAEDSERFLASIIAESDRLTRLANDLLALQRIEGATGELPLRVVDLRTAAERVASAFAPLMEDRGVDLAISGSAPKVLGDLDRLQQVIANLVDNASRYVGTGGHVTVELGSEADWGVLSVLDDGPGIPAEDLPRLFDRFYRSQPSRDRESGGSGLGLAIVKAIVAAHGGRIEAANLDGGGSRFTVRLPALREG